MNAVLPNRTINQLDHSGKIKSQHLSRKAIIYIRQSTLQQVHRHQESTRLQYGLVDKAILLGWPQSDIEVIDDDLGCSGATIAGRHGFQRLVAEVGLDHVGMVLGSGNVTVIKVIAGLVSITGSLRDFQYTYWRSRRHL